jgi:transcription initiation factor TFIID subunit 10
LLRNKDVNDFMVALDDYAPTLPTEVAYYYLGKGGANIHDPRAVKMVSLAADKLMADILFDARQFNLLRQQSNNPRVKRKAEADASTLQFDDLVRSLRMRGVHIHRPAAPRDADTSSSAATAPSAVAVAASERDGGEGAT